MHDRTDWDDVARNIREDADARDCRAGRAAAFRRSGFSATTIRSLLRALRAIYDGRKEGRSSYATPARFVPWMATTHPPCDSTTLRQPSVTLDLFSRRQAFICGGLPMCSAQNLLASLWQVICSCGVGTGLRSGGLGGRGEQQHGKNRNLHKTPPWECRWSRRGSSGPDHLATAGRRSMP